MTLAQSTYATDAAGTFQQSPVTGTTTYEYDDAGNLTYATAANGASAVRTYDLLNRVQSAVSTRAGVYGLG